MIQSRRLLIHFRALQAQGVQSHGRIMCSQFIQKPEAIWVLKEKDIYTRCTLSFPTNIIIITIVINYYYYYYRYHC